MKKIWTPKEVEEYLKNTKPEQKKTLPEDVYCTENFTWNEILMTKNRNIDVPTQEVLENLQHSANNLQKYRNKINAPFYITSSWRTPQEQEKLINDFKIGKSKNKPSETSLHLEGLALDFVVPNNYQQQVQKLLDENHLGELELGNDYTHVALPTFSKSYLERNGIYNDKIYKQLQAPELSELEKQKIIKRMNPQNWQPLRSNFNKQSNFEMFSNNKSAKEFSTTNINQLAKQFGLKSFDMKLPTQTQQPTSNFGRYNTPSESSNRIFTREDVGSMSKEEFAKNEKDIMNQVKTMNGKMPSNADLEREILSGSGTVFVNSYTRSDGTEVKGYYRNKSNY